MHNPDAVNSADMKTPLISLINIQKLKTKTYLFIYCKKPFRYISSIHLIYSIQRMLKTLDFPNQTQAPEIQAKFVLSIKAFSIFFYPCFWSI